MNLLVFDQHYETERLNYIQPLIDNIKELQADVLFDFTKVKLTFEQMDYDFIIIDFNTTEGKAFLDYVLSHKPQQKIITLSYDLKSSQENCQECEYQYNKRRLIKPVDAVTLFRTIKNFDLNRCKYYNHFINPSILIEDLVNRYDYFEYNDQTRLIQKIEFSNDYILKEFIDIIDVLKQYNITYEIIDEYSVKIL